MDIKARNKQIKKILADNFGNKSVSVTGGKGTAYGWVSITIKTEDPCPFKQHEEPCSSYLGCANICKGNKQPINGGWGGTVRQLKYSEISEKAKALIKGVEMHSFYSDDYSDNTPKSCCNISVTFK